MDKKKRLAMILVLLLTWSLCLAATSWAAPSFLGTWNGTAPKITLQGCSNESITLTITSQCGNLFRGTVSNGTTSISVVGKYSADGNVVSIIGEFQDLTNYILDMVTLTGTYVAGTPASLAVMSFMFTHSDLNSSNTDEFNVEYDNFSLIKQ